VTYILVIEPDDTSRLTGMFFCDFKKNATFNLITDLGTNSGTNTKLINQSTALKVLNFRAD
jgi:hypothetical protein